MYSAKKAAKHGLWTTLDVTYVITQKDYIESCPVNEHSAYKIEKKRAEETNLILAIHDEELSASPAVPSTSGHFPLLKWVKSTMYSHRSKQYLKLPEHCQDLQIPDAFRTTVAGKDFLLWQSVSKHILGLATGSNITLMAIRRTWYIQGCTTMVSTTVYHPCLSGEQGGASSLLFMYGKRYCHIRVYFKQLRHNRQCSASILIHNL
ncbi:hypothetical protein T4B_15449 [Trichinella pseudospiralis]|uniref:Uncharacterized protein n=1 Tax=Trichinella pseudospiralis TaxID=6337 RepID=A0A0V1H6S0_TRIPS|nr:hypothetical protein T4B_15449 [Trichinella pseudospiralis]